MEREPRYPKVLAASRASWPFVGTIAQPSRTPHRHSVQHDLRRLFSNDVHRQPLLVGEAFERLAQAEWITADAGGGEMHEDHLRLKPSNDSDYRGSNTTANYRTPHQP